MNILKNINWTYVIIGILIFIVFTIFCGNMLTSNQSTNGSSENFYEGLDESNETSNEVVKSNGDKGEIALYYASWCGWSQKILPEWEKFEQAAKENLPGLRVTRVQCEGDNEAKCMQQGIEGYPTIIFYTKDGNKVTFEDDRNSDKLFEFAKQNTN